MISVAALIIAIPAAAALPAMVFRRQRWLETLIAVAAVGVCALLLLLPGPTLNVGVTTIDIGAPLSIFGRVLRVRAYEQYPLACLYLGAFVVYAMSGRSSSGWTFVPIGLAVLSIVTAALLVRPLVFSALLMVVAGAFVALMVQAEHVGQRSTLGATRFLIVPILALPFFLAAGFVLAQASQLIDPALQAAAREPGAFILIGACVLLSGAFPLFTWTHPVVRDAPALVSAFVASIMLTASASLVLSLVVENPWLADTAAFALLKIFGIAMVAMGTGLAWAQRSFARVLACAISIDIGASLLLTQIGGVASLEAIALGALSRALSLSVLALGLSILRASRESDDFARLGGLFHAGPSAQVACLAIALGGLSLAGAPGTIGFVVLWARLRVLAPADIEIAALLVFATASVATGFARGLAAMLSTAQTGLPHHPIRLIRREYFAVLGASLLVMAFGFAPQLPAMLAHLSAAGYLPR